MRILACLALVFIVSACTNLSDQKATLLTLPTIDIRAEREKWIPLAKAGDAEAQFRLGDSYQYKNFPDYDPVKGVFWLRKAVEQGHTGAKDELGTAYKRGRGVPKDHAKSVYWLTQAANDGHAQSALTLAETFQLGEGTEKNEQEAKKWMALAARLGDSEMLYRIGYIYVDENECLPSDIKQGIVWFKRAIDQGDPYAYSLLGDLYMQGCGLPWDPIKGINLYLKSHKLGYYSAMAKLGKAYRKMVISKQLNQGFVDFQMGQKLSAEAERTGNFQLALSRYLAAAKLGSGQAAYAIAKLQEAGKAPPKVHQIESLGWRAISFSLIEPPEIDDDFDKIYGHISGVEKNLAFAKIVGFLVRIIREGTDHRLD
jgi:hypothetical protein